MWFRRPQIGQTYPATLGGRFTWVIDLVCWGIGDYADSLRLRPAAPRPASSLPASQLAGVGWYVRRLLNRFLALLARAEAGTLRPPRPQPPRPRPPRPPEPAPAIVPADPPPKRERLRLPRGFAWMIRCIPPTPPAGNPIAAAREGLGILLADAEMATLLATAPQAGRLLRPLCHALGISPLPESLRRPPRPPDPARQAARAEARAARAGARRNARAEARAEAAWARACRRSLGFPARPARDVPDTRARPPPKRA